MENGNKVIYCFSGTGNSLNAARIIAKEIGGATIVSVKKRGHQRPCR